MAPPTQHPLYHILEVEYDDQHRALILSDNDTEVALPTLKPHTHTRAHQWDEPYGPYIWRAGFLELVRVVKSGAGSAQTQSRDNPSRQQRQRWKRSAASVPGCLL